MVYNEDDVRKLISEFVYRLTVVMMDDEEIQMFIRQWLRNPDGITNNDFERLHGILFETDNDINLKDQQDFKKLR